MDDSTAKMVAEAYDETYSESLAQGRSTEVAHREGVTAAAMFLASMTGLEDAAAIAEVEGLGLRQ
ncbi:hypothetical protein [Magnetospirillum molischianum]|uniref:Uncharacterized protein n=1 Tax=Magnetospirillum molischianum DSM 120 TaxID=1150626 RepID=H8FN67_MAGML|nr:hypothetical protein [Magnetospirillum molischianum]CCG39805.1 conserved hypothetical protein [Magnetospirillum molischianum DSM 120]